MKAILGILGDWRKHRAWRRFIRGKKLTRRQENLACDYAVDVLLDPGRHVLKSRDWYLALELATYNPVGRGAKEANHER